MTDNTLKKGMLWLRGALSDSDLAELDEVSTTTDTPGARKQLDGTAKTSISAVNRQVHTIDPDMNPVRLVAFDKTATSNWALPWHQDRVIAVKEKHDLAGYGNWSRKKGVWHCEPPLSLLERMLFVRVHLDDTGADDGAMEVAVGSHAAGKVTADQAESIADHYPKHVCSARRGDILILDMLTLHRSLPARAPTARRTLRIDYASVDLPLPLAWAE